MSTNFNRGDTGIHTVEGNLAGHKAARLTKKREKDQQEFEAKKLKMQADAQKGTGAIDDKFKSSTHNAFGVRTRVRCLVLLHQATDDVRVWWRRHYYSWTSLA